jgi:hypothetical protein
LRFKADDFVLNVFACYRLNALQQLRLLHCSASAAPSRATTKRNSPVAFALPFASPASDALAARQQMALDIAPPKF